MLKQLAWAAAMSSSGFAPGVPSKRVLKLYGVPLIAPLATANVPLPSLRLPSHMALALRFMIGSPFRSVTIYRARRDVKRVSVRKLRERDADAFSYTVFCS